MTDRLRVAVLYGGNSSEREISLASGEVVFKHLDPAKFAARLVDLRELLPGGTVDLAEFARATDVAFIALHGPGGEDGRLQGLLELYGVPYTGSGVLASALAMEKSVAKAIYRQAGLPVARDLVFAAHEVRAMAASSAVARVGAELGWPAVVKADNQGSTRGVQIARSPEEFGAAWEEAAHYGSAVLVEEFVAGREFTVPVLGGAAPEAFPVVEIVPKAAEFFTYEAKYAPGGSDEIVPARIGAELTRRLQDLGVAAHTALGCWGVSRTDVLVSEDRGPVLLETNTIPGMTEGSLLPKSVKAAGWTFAQFAEKLIDWALERFPDAARPSPAAMR
ncbi:MAG: D-alanine--D-alanine ligase [Candidatus Sericytochromatia bacterium]|nr:D-alanine--D-alanine ligase [Candidatus Tanganyikabacteria bacterium]